jgi:hypothetical protein
MIIKVIIFSISCSVHTHSVLVPYYFRTRSVPFDWPNLPQFNDLGETPPIWSASIPRMSVLDSGRLGRIILLVIKKKKKKKKQYP